MQTLFVGIELEPPRYCLFLHDGFFGLDCIVNTTNTGDNARSKATSRPSSNKPSTILEQTESEIINWLNEYAQQNRVKFAAAGIGLSAGEEICIRRGSIHLRRKKLADRIGRLTAGFRPHDVYPLSPAVSSRELASTSERDDETELEGATSSYSWIPYCDDDSCSTNPSDRLRLPVRLWKELDILPFLIDTRGRSIDERACQAVRKVMGKLSPGANCGNIPRNPVGFRHEVELDQFIRICDLEDYCDSVPKEVWEVVQSMADGFRKRKSRLSFFSSTSQGGGVALMRHGILRISRLEDLAFHWYVARPNPIVFEITKHKFHNTLQGVSPPDIVLTENDTRIWETWCKENAERYWKDEPFKRSTVIVLDDPQLLGIIPHIRAVNRTCKLVFRCHIHLNLSLLNQEGENEAKRVWKYLWGFIEQCDSWVFHPIPEALFYMGATTDLQDGLNKELRPVDISYYLDVFNTIAHSQTLNRADWKRPYLLQVSRFDPSKGIPDVLEAYRILCKRIHRYIPMAKVPQLIVTGVGSIDDPDGAPVFEEVKKKLDGDEFNSCRNDVILARLPPSDQILNGLMRNAMVALQLSTSEGYEIKVTEALVKGVPVVVYGTGGIPLQVRHGETGFIAPTGDTNKVAVYLEELISDPEKRTWMAGVAQSEARQDHTRFNVGQFANWLYVSERVEKRETSCSSGGDAIEGSKEGNAVGESDGGGGGGDAVVGASACDEWMARVRRVPQASAGWWT
ncbi:hypothetical protein DFJ73DRAFT_827522 [Zopfochytrium polystomum]|nr:hypothetical protein DFJ73DRAFT_827522 [Zopfochytrium polystomum]